MFHVQWDEQEVLRQLQQLARRNARWLRLNRSTPLLYDSGVIYRTEAEETFRDVYNTLKNGDEDCDSLAAWRAGEILARGSAAFAPGDPGWSAVRRSGVKTTIPAEVMLTTRARAGTTGNMYHAIVRYQVNGKWIEEDPSERLGMRRDTVDPYVVARWRKRGILDKLVDAWAQRGVNLNVSEPLPAASSAPDRRARRARAGAPRGRADAGRRTPRTRRAGRPRRS